MRLYVSLVLLLTSTQALAAPYSFVCKTASTTDSQKMEMTVVYDPATPQTAVIVGNNGTATVEADASEFAGLKKLVLLEKTGGGATLITIFLKQGSQQIEVIYTRNIYIGGIIPSQYTGTCELRM